MKIAKASRDRPLANCCYPANVATSTTDLDINDLFSLELKYEHPEPCWLGVFIKINHKTHAVRDCSMAKSRIVNTQGWANNIYIVEMRFGKEAVRQKLVVQR